MGSMLHELFQSNHHQIGGNMRDASALSIHRFANWKHDRMSKILAKSRDACNERMDVGRCQGSFESYYYEKATGTCEQFRYSGCGGTANRFHSKQQCEELCMRPAFVPPRFGHAAAGRVSYPPMRTNELSGTDISCLVFIFDWSASELVKTATAHHSHALYNASLHYSRTL